MSNITLENVVAVNQELAALAEAGIPTNLAPGGSPEAIAAAVQQINDSLQLRSDLGQPLLEATAENQELPAVYRGALAAGLRSNRLAATLEGMSRQSTADRELHSTIGRSLIAPLIVASLAYLGFIVLSLSYSPAIAAMYEQVGQTPSFSARILLGLREWMPYWAVLFPLCMLIGILLWRSGWGKWQRWVPGAKRYASAIRNASFAHQLRLLIENEVPLNDSLPLAAAVTGDAPLIASATVLSQTQATEKPLAADARELRALPPLLRWALTGDLGDQSLPEILRFAEQTYRKTAARRAAAWRVLLPATIGALLGGFVVLVYALSLFGPFAQLLQDLVY